MLSNIAAGSMEHKQLIYTSDAVPLLIRLLSSAPFDVRKEVAYVLGNLCVAPDESEGKAKLLVENLVSLVGRGCLQGFIDLVRSADTEAARLGFQFMEMVSTSDCSYTVFKLVFFSLSLRGHPIKLIFFSFVIFSIGGFCWDINLITDFLGEATIPFICISYCSLPSELVTCFDSLVFKKTSRKIFVILHNDHASSCSLAKGIERHAKWGGPEAG